jgi:hypothetical protein|tara:strand:- start:20 stop:709 length:690 start_codon:yes stop_codon:yes gene_type:complete
MIHGVNKMMKISEETIEVLKNFSTINQNLLIKQGNVLTTMSSMKNIMAKATVKEDFPQEVAIYDLNEFLSAISIFQKPEFDFQDNYVLLSEENSKGKSLKYFYSDPSVITSPTKEIKMPQSEVEFEFKNETFKEVTRASAVLGVPDMLLNGTGALSVTDKKNDASNNFSVDVSPTGTGDYKFYFKVENLKILSGDYDVKISSKNISNFVNKNKDIQYWIALEPESTYSV